MHGFVPLKRKVHLSSVQIFKLDYRLSYRCDYEELFTAGSDIVLVDTGNSA
jgi:hypothetical protein